MKNINRSNQKYQRRQYKRQLNKLQRVQEIGGIHSTLSFSEVYNAGKQCCTGVRWKATTQRFEATLFSNTARVFEQIQSLTWKPHKRHKFRLSERGKTRDIEAPCISDRQVEKAITKNILLPLYVPQMIHNNGASLKGKGFRFSMNTLKEELREHFRKYGREGSIILIDFKGYFPNANHKAIYKRHTDLILDEDLRYICDLIIRSSGKGGYGMPLGVEPSQAEMIALPSALDNYFKCQLSLKGGGHYMDDYNLLIPPGTDPTVILEEILNIAERDGFIINRNKVKIQPLTKPFIYCKAKYYLTETGKIITRGSKASRKSSRKQAKTLYKLLKDNRITFEDVWASISGRINYFDNYNDHNNQLKIARLFFHLFNFSCSKIENFRAQGAI